MKKKEYCSLYYDKTWDDCFCFLTLSFFSVCSTQSTKHTWSVNMSKPESSVTNFKLNEQDEIEFAEQQPDSEEGFDSDNAIVDEDTMLLVPKGNGVMSIRKQNSVDHICTKCNKPYNSSLGLKRHMNLCRHLPKMQNVTKIPNLLHDVHSVGDEAAKDDKCFCCFEENAIAHVRQYIKICLKID